MATKRKARKVVRKPKSTPPERMMDAMNQVWLAGLGAMSKTRQGAPLMLHELVAEGARIQADTRDGAEKMLGGLKGNLKATIDSGVKQVRGQAGDALDNLEQMFQTRVHRALTQLGVPSAEDVEKLSHKVEQLNASINKLAADRRLVNTVARARPRTMRIAHKPGLGTSRAAAR
jgi:poly(hydroxyalkanoate) granule-associated protein